MAMQLKNGKKGLLNEINVTPFIDVCLVLLIIFMIVVTATMLQLGYLSRLPRADVQPPHGGNSPEQIVVRLLPPCLPGQLETCQVYINRDFVPVNSFMSQMQAIAKSSANQTVFFYAEDSVNYENAMTVLDLMKNAGATNIGLLTEQYQ